MITTATLNPILTEFAQQFMRDPKGFVADEIAPYFPAPLQSSSYYLFRKDDIANVPLLTPRAPGAPYQRIQTTLTSDNYACENYGLEAPAPDEERKKYGAYFDLDRLKVNRLIDTIRVNREVRVTNLLTGSGVASANISIPWNDPAANPLQDVDAAKEFIRQNTGLRATHMVISEPTFLSLRYNQRLLDFYKFTTAGTLTEELLAAAFGLKKLVVARNIQATNNEGATFTPADIWGNKALICAINDTDDLEAPTLCRSFNWTAFTSLVTQQDSGGPGYTAGGAGPEAMQIFTYRDEIHKSDVHRGDHYLAEKIVAADAGYTLNGCLG